MPIPDADAKAQAPIVKLVEKILAAKRANPEADIAELEREVDARVHRLYGLTPEESKIVEGEPLLLNRAGAAIVDSTVRIRPPC